MSYVLQRPGLITQTWRRDKLSGLGAYQLQRPGLISQTWRRDKLSGLGTAAFLGPDQPWSAQTASTWITQRTRQCESGREILIGGLNPPKATTDGKVVRTDRCYATGRVKESSKPGYQRVQEWCCQVDRPAVVTKPVTQEQAEQYATLCDGKPLSLPGGGSVLTTLGWWLHNSAHVPSGMCRESGVRDGEYRLLCCRDPDEARPVAMVAGTTAARTVAPTTAQIEAQTRQQEEQVARTETVLVASQEPSYGIWDRYKWVIILGGGALVFGLLAGGIKRRFDRRRG
jgi:hypothetical protein